MKSNKLNSLLISRVILIASVQAIGLDRAIAQTSAQGLPLLEELAVKAILLQPPSTSPSEPPSFQGRASVSSRGRSSSSQGRVAPLPRPSPGDDDDVANLDSLRAGLREQRRELEIARAAALRDNRGLQSEQESFEVRDIERSIRRDEDRIVRATNRLPQILRETRESGWGVATSETDVAAAACPAGQRPVRVRDGATASVRRMIEASVSSYLGAFASQGASAIRPPQSQTPGVASSRLFGCIDESSRLTQLVEPSRDDQDRITRFERDSTGAITGITVEQGSMRFSQTRSSSGGSNQTVTWRDARMAPAPPGAIQVLRECTGPVGSTPGRLRAPPTQNLTDAFASVTVTIADPGSPPPTPRLVEAEGEFRQEYDQVNRRLAEANVERLLLEAETVQIEKRPDQVQRRQLPQVRERRRRLSIEIGELTARQSENERRRREMVDGARNQWRPVELDSERERAGCARDQRAVRLQESVPARFVESCGLVSSDSGFPEPAIFDDRLANALRDAIRQKIRIDVRAERRSTSRDSAADLQEQGIEVGRRIREFEADQRAAGRDSFIASARQRLGDEDYARIEARIRAVTQSDCARAVDTGLRLACLDAANRIVRMVSSARGPNSGPQSSEVVEYSRDSSGAVSEIVRTTADSRATESVLRNAGQIQSYRIREERTVTTRSRASTSTSYALERDCAYYPSGGPIIAAQAGASPDRSPIEAAPVER